MGLFSLQFLVFTIPPQSSAFPFISNTHSAAQLEKPQDGGGLESTKDVCLSSELQRLIHNSCNGEVFLGEADPLRKTWSCIFDEKRRTSVEYYYLFHAELTPLTENRYFS